MCGTLGQNCGAGLDLTQSELALLSKPYWGCLFNFSKPLRLSPCIYHNVLFSMSAFLLVASVLCI